MFFVPCCSSLLELIIGEEYIAEKSYLSVSCMQQNNMLAAFAVAFMAGIESTIN